MRGQRYDARGDAIELDLLRYIPAKDLKEASEIRATECLKAKTSSVGQTACSARSTPFTETNVHASVAETDSLQLAPLPGQNPREPNP